MSDNKTESKNLSSYEHKSIGRKLSEAAFDGIGTFLFMTAILFSGGDFKIFCFAFWVVLSIFGGISGGHVNPAITLGFYVTDADWGYGLMKLGLYTFFQFLGCALAAIMRIGVLGTEGENFIFTINGNEETAGKAFFGEFFFTGTFLFTILCCTHPKYAPSKIAPINTAIIIAWFACAASVGGRLSGSAYNPAVLITISFIAKFKVTNLALKVLGELAGVIVFALIYKFVYCPMVEAVNSVESPKGYSEIKQEEQAQV